MIFKQIAFVQIRERATTVMLFVILVVVLGKAGVAQVPSDPANVIGGAVLLSNDRTIEGRVEQVGAFYRITVGQNSTVSIPREKVRFLAEDMRGLYQQKCEAIPKWEIGDHFQMARWSMLNGLLPEAVKHYRIVQKQHPDHRSVRQLAIEIETKLLEIPEFRKHLGLNPETEVAYTGATQASQVATQAAGKVNGQNAGRGAPIAEGNAASRSTRQAIATGSTRASTSGQAEVSKASATYAGLNLENAVMHPEVAARFTQRIQPILLNRCSQAACHGGQSKNAFRIVEPYRAAFERQTDQNLQSVLRQVSKHPNRLSELLRYATTAHGIQKQAGISVTETELLSELTQWIRMVQQPVQSAVAHSPAATDVRRAVGQGYPATALVPVQPGSSGLKPVPKLAAPGIVDAQGALGDFPVRDDFPDGDAPGMDEIDRLDDQLRRVLGEPPRSLPNRRESTTRQNSVTGMAGYGSGQDVRYPPEMAQPTTPTSARGPAGEIQGGAKTLDPFDPDEFNRQNASGQSSGR